MEDKPAELGGIQVAGLASVLALACALAGWLGLQLTVPPRDVAIVWPSAGIAMAALLIVSPRLAPGVFVASLIVSLGAANLLAGGLSGRNLAVALIIASGSTLQALAGSGAARRLFGVPTWLRSGRDVIIFAAVVGPVASTISPTIGTLALVLAGILPPGLMAGHWLNWWLGNLVGIAVVLPLALLGPWRHLGAGWSSLNSAGLQPASLIALTIALLLTFAGWRWTGENAYARGEAAFVSLAGDAEQALQYRLASYAQALDGAAGLFHASSEVTEADWARYVDELDIGAQLPGIVGMGVLDDVTSGGDAGEHPFVTRFIELLVPSATALGLDNSFDANRREAAVMARASGRPAITKRLFLVQGSRIGPGFLLLKPTYRPGQPLNSVSERLAAFEGWVFAPFIGARIMQDLTSSQSENLHMQVYDGAKVDVDRLIYSSRPASDALVAPTFTQTRTITVMGQLWTIVWNSTRQFDGTIKNNEPLFVLLSGLVLSALFAGFLVSYAGRQATIREQVVQKTREIAAREEENRSVVDTAVVGIVLLDDEGRVLSANEAALRIFDLRAEDMAAKCLHDLLQIETGTTIGDVLGGSQSSGPLRARPATGLSRGGKRLNLELQLNAWRTAAGEQRYTALVRDVTLESRITAALEDAEERWSSALRGARIGVFDVDVSTGRSIVSDTWWEMLGYASADAEDPQTVWRQRVHADDLPGIDASDAACFAGTAMRSEGEYRIRHRNGKWIWLRYDASVTRRDEEGRALRLVGTQTDITALKIAEEGLRSSEERLRTAIGDAPIGMALIDPAGAWIDVNGALLNFLGYSREAFLALNFRELSLPEDAGLDVDLIPRLVAGEISDYQLERRYRHSAGHAVWGLLSVSVARAADGTIDYFIAQIQDIDHRKDMDRIKSEFISNVSHELRTPLTSIRGALGLILGAMADDIPDGITRLLTIAHKNSERLILLINDILDLEKMSTENLQFEIGPHSLRQEVLLAMESNQGFASQFEVNYVLDTPETDMECLFDTDRLHQVLSNLLSNAAKFSPHGGTVHLGLETVGDMARVSITDQGVGIPASFRNRIFSAFSQADASATRGAGGTGLGLHISKQMMEKMEGTLDYASVEGQGSTFWVDLQLSQARLAYAADQRAGMNGSQLPQLLHVDNDARFRDFIANALDERLDISHATTLQRAREMLAQQHFDLIVLDVHLPDGQGTDLLDDVQRSGRHPFVVLTLGQSGVVDQRVQASVVKSGADEGKIVELILGAAAPPLADARRSM